MNIFPTECSFQQCLQFIWTLLSTHWFLEVWSRHVLLKNRNVGFFFPYGKNTSSCVRVSSPFESLCCWDSFPYVPSIPIGKKKKTWFIVQKQCLDWCHCSCHGESSCGYPCAPCGVGSALCASHGCSEQKWQVEKMSTYSVRGHLVWERADGAFLPAERYEYSQRGSSEVNKDRWRKLDSNSGFFDWLLMMSHALASSIQ